MLLELKNISKTYYTDTGVTFRALSNISTVFDRTGLVYVLGKSGSGKSTLLNILGALDNYDSGELWVGDKLTKNMTANMLDYYRNTMAGFVFQEFNLIDSLSVMENVRFALDIKYDKDIASTDAPKESVLKILETMGIKDKAYAKARDLSGGQRQRVAIARALIKNPQIILADEPTGSLDSVTGNQITEILADIAKERLVIVVTHDLHTAAKYGDRIIEMKDGRIYRDVKRRQPGESIMTSGIDIISDTLVRLEKDTLIDQAFTDKINGVISETGRRAYLNIETSGNRTKALFPNLRDAVESDAASHNQPVRSDGETADNGAAELLKGGDFLPYKPEKSEPEKPVFNKSKMAFKSALKMGVHNLKLKKFRLALIILVTCISFTLFGAVNTLSSVDTARSLSKSIAHDNVQVLSVSKNFIYGKDSSDVISAKTIEKLKQKHKSTRIYNQYFQPLNVLSFSAAKAAIGGYHFSNFTGITEIDNITNLNFNILYGSPVPDTPYSVIISQYAAGALISGGTFAKSSSQEEVPPEMSAIIGRTFSVGGYEVIISGIYESDYKPYNDFNNEQLIDSYNHVFQLFVGQDSGFLKKFNSYSGTQSRAYISGNFESLSQSLNFSGVPLIVAKYSDSSSGFINADPVEFGSEPSENRKGFYLIVDGIYQQTELEEQVMENILFFNRSDNLYLNIGKNNGYTMNTDNSYYYNDYYDRQDYYNSVDGLNVVSDIIYTLSSYDYYIKGYIMSEGGFRGVALDSQTYEDYLQNLEKPRQLLINLGGSQKENYALIKDLFANDLQINAEFNFLFTIYLAIFLSFKSAIMGASVFLSFLASLLMFNFISTSIKLTKRNIGLLRALGVKKLHTFLVYVMEGLVIAAITFAVAALALTVIMPAINSALSSKIGVYMPIMTADAKIFLQMSGLALAVSVIATFVPWFRFAKITPVDAIYGRN